MALKQDGQSSCERGSIIFVQNARTWIDGPRLPLVLVLPLRVLPHDVGQCKISRFHVDGLERVMRADPLPLLADLGQRRPLLLDAHPRDRRPLLSPTGLVALHDDGSSEKNKNGRQAKRTLVGNSNGQCEDVKNGDRGGGGVGPYSDERRPKPAGAMLPVHSWGQLRLPQEGGQEAQEAKQGLPPQHLGHEVRGRHAWEDHPNEPAPDAHAGERGEADEPVGAQLGLGHPWGRPGHYGVNESGKKRCVKT